MIRVRYINIYPPELCHMGQEEFVHQTEDAARRHLNPGGEVVRFIEDDARYTITEKGKEMLEERK